MRRDNHGRKRSGKGFDDKTKYARLLAIPAAIVIVLLIVILVMDKKPGNSKPVSDSTVSDVSSDISIEDDSQSSADDDSVEADHEKYLQITQKYRF